jgi:hypothetical protein
METFIFSVSSYDRDGRLRALVNVFCHISKVSIITKYKPSSVFLRCDVHYCKMSFLNTIRQIKFFIDYMKKSSKSDFILIDNRKAALFALIFYPIIKQRIVIYDMREFYMCQNENTVKSSIGTYIESVFLKLADAVICPNQHRARLVKVQYGLKHRPFILENNRQIVLDARSKNILDGLNDKENPIMAESEKQSRLNFVSTDGFSYARESPRVIQACANFSSNINLYIFGNGKEKADSYIRDNDLKNIYHLGVVDANILGEFLKYMDAGFVVYGSHDLNNKYCASGKIYEFIHLGIPVVTSNNAPLRAITHRHGVGVSTEDIGSGIKEIIDYLDHFKARCVEFSAEMDVEKFELVSAKMLIDYLGETRWTSDAES